jgi:hypothetical protein
MHNLLPQENIKSLRKEYALRLSVMAIIFLFVLGMIVCADFFPAYLAAVGQEQVAVAQEQKERSSGNSVASATAISTLQRAENEVAMVEGLQTTDIHDILARIAGYRTGGIQLIGITVGPVAIGQGQNQGKQGPIKTRAIGMTGIAATREALVNFSQALQAQKNLSGVDVPVSDFSKESNIGFTVNVSMQVQ